MKALLYGNLTNRLMEQTDTLPTIGQGVTVCMHSDRYAGTVVFVDPIKETFLVQRDRATRVDRNGISESQVYDYHRNPIGQLYSFKRCRKNSRLAGRFRENGLIDGAGIVIGRRDEYFDFSF